jgi:hypothetical protein
MAGRHALNVEIEVRVLVPKWADRSPARLRRAMVTSIANDFDSALGSRHRRSRHRGQSHGRVAQLAEHLSDTEEEAGSIPAPPIKRGRVAQKGRALVLHVTQGVAGFDSSLAHPRGRSSKQVERPLETRGVAGSIPADHTSGSVAQFGRAADS